MQNQIAVGARIAAGLLLLVGRALCLAPEAVAWWSFDAEEAKALDRISNIQDVVKGRFSHGPGIAGNSLRFDGFTTMIVREASAAPVLKHGLAIEAWIAPQEYSWNWTAIVNQGSDLKTGYFFGMDYMGCIGLSVAINGTWQTLVTKEKLPLLKWSHVLGSFDPKVGLTIYINGRSAGRLEIEGTLGASNVEVWVGASQMLMGVANTEREPSRKALEHTRMVFDGLIDEVKIYDGPLSAVEAAVLFSAVRVPEEPPLRYRVLPSGPKQVRKFGAFYEQLRYSEGWDALWRGSGPDVVVSFDFAPIRLVGWRGISYAPSWVTENGNWFSNEFMERSVPGGCAESMSDKQARYSSVKILEANDARAILYWRYSPVDINYQIPFIDPITGWGDWAEEYYTVYPDGIAVRKFVGWTSVPRQESFLEWSQSLPILQPGQRPEDVLNPDSFITLANMHGQSQTYRWPPSQPEIKGPGANIQVVNYKAEYKPFLILTDRNPRITLPKHTKREPGTEIRGMSMPEGSQFWWWNHWPVAQLPSDGRVAPAADRPSHSWAATQDSTPWETTDVTETQIMLCGLTKRSAEELVPVAKSWLRAPAITLRTAGYTTEGFDPSQRAYVVAAPSTAPSALRFTVDATADSPILNPAFVVRGWGEAGVGLELDGHSVARGATFRYGYDRKLERTDLIVWIQAASTSPMSFALTPISSKNEQ